MATERERERERERVLFLASERERVRHIEERANALGMQICIHFDVTVREASTRMNSKAVLISCLISKLWWAKTLQEIHVPCIHIQSWAFRCSRFAHQCGLQGQNLRLTCKLLLENETKHRYKICAVCL